MNTDRFNSSRWLRRLAIATAVTTVLAAVPAWADVITWNYSVDTTFDDPATGTGGLLHPSNGDTLLCWGTPAGGGAGHAPCPDVGLIDGANRSALQIDPATASGQINTIIGNVIGSGNLEPATVLTHFNNPLSGNSNSLRTATLLNTVTLSSSDPSGGTSVPWSMDFSINFTETTNVAPCAAPPAGNPCSDIFVLGQNALNQSFVYPDDGKTYFLHFVAMGADGNPLPALSASACSAAGVFGTCYGFITEEGLSNPMHLGIAISTEEIGVPEPGALGLMGLGVLGIGLALGLNRRRRSAGTA